MSSAGTHTHWGMVINNYDAKDLALLENAYPDHIRKLVYTKEVAPTTGTPHIQAFIKMKRDCRLSHMRKLFPGASFQFLDSLEYRRNAESYAQKQDETADGPSVIVNGDPLHTIEGIIRNVCERIIRDEPEESDLDIARRRVERMMVLEDYTMAKVFVSSTYKAMWKSHGHEMFENIFHTHTHTHTQVVEVPTLPPGRVHEQKHFREIGTQTDDAELAGGSEDEVEDDSEGEGDGSGSDAEGSGCSGDSDCEEDSGSEH